MDSRLDCLRRGRVYATVLINNGLAARGTATPQKSEKFQ